MNSHSSFSYPTTEQFSFAQEDALQEDTPASFKEQQQLPAKERAVPNEDARFYGRRKGRAFSSVAQDDFDRLLKRYAVDLDGIDHLCRDQGASVQKPLWLEIGFGGGEHLVAQAQANPEVHIIGAEPFENGVLSCLRALEAQGLENVSIWHQDVRQLLPRLGGNVLDRLFVLFPDPWRKTRHHKRRLISTPMLDIFATCLKPQGELRIASDHDGYVEWIQTVLKNQKPFLPEMDIDNPPTVRPSSWYATRYEQKALKAGRLCRYFTLMRK